MDLLLHVLFESEFNSFQKLGNCSGIGKWKLEDGMLAPLRGHNSGILEKQLTEIHEQTNKLGCSHMANIFLPCCTKICLHFFKKGEHHLPEMIRQSAPLRAPNQLSNPTKRNIEQLVLFTGITTTVTNVVQIFFIHVFELAIQPSNLPKCLNQAISMSIILPMFSSTFP
jgi:hypothetical protein